MAVILEVQNRDDFDLYQTLHEMLALIYLTQNQNEDTTLYSSEALVIKATLFDMEQSQPPREWQDQRRKEQVLYYTLKGEGAKPIASKLGIQTRSVQRIRQRLREEGLLESWH